MSTDISEKSSRKHKKSKAHADAEPDSERAEKPPRKFKKARSDDPADPEDGPQETVDTRASESAAEEIAPSKKEKKDKKRKHTDAVDEPTQNDVEKPKKKKKSREQAEAPAAEPESAAVASEDAEQPEEEEAKTSKKSKGKKRKTEGASEDAATAGNAVEEEGDVDPAAHSDARSPKPKRDKKKDKSKRKKGARDDEDEQAVEGDATSSSKPKKKRKRRSASGFPDPTGDEALSEQAQKALHYAFTQFEEPGEWKFNKARQNWIIRNIWSAEAIPDTYIPLATKYLQGVQGGAREALVKSCQEALEPAQPTTQPAPAEASKAAPAESETQDSPTKRTVKFEVPDTQSSSNTAAANETKRQRAEALLAVLTSNTSS